MSQLPCWDFGSWNKASL
uniref:Uncharacterized protein n=1 Tax=Arundo donax TaxID=35708 RepID=A0A0A8ZYQ9_ARUDO